MNKFLFILAVIPTIFISGCISNTTVETTKPWENHYFTVKEFKENTKDIKLDKNESIWVLSNRTMKRLFKNMEKYYE